MGEKEGNQLKRTLSFKIILLITINSIMGTGIYFLPALGVKVAGPASIISWLILSVISIYIAMCFGELASMFPKSGGVYEYAKQAYGRGASFFVGWTAIVTSNITIAMLVVGGIQYLIPQQSTFMKLIFALSVIGVFHFVAYRGMKLSASMLVVFATITLTAFIILIIFGLPKVQPSNFTPFFVFAPSAVLVAIFFIAETFFGWESATFLAEETKNPEKVMPKALIVGTMIIAGISLLLVITSVGIIEWNIFGDSETPLLDLSRQIFGNFGSGIFQFVIGFTIMGSAASWVVSAPRLILALTKDRLFLQQFKSIHPKYNTPHKAIVLQYFIASAMIVLGFGQYTTLLELLIPLILVVYGMVLLSVVILRNRRPELERPFKVPFGKHGPTLVVMIFLALLINWIFHVEDALVLLRFGISIVSIGIPLYILIEMYYDPDMIKEVGDITSRVNLMFEKALLPREIKEDIITFLGDMEGKTLLDFGCGSGSLAISLSKHIGPTGRVFAVDYSKHKLKIINKKVFIAGFDDYSEIYSHMTLIHDPDMLKRVHPDVPYVDFAVSVNTLSSLQNVDKVINDLSAKIPEEGKICFVEAVDYFGVIPNVAWLNERRLKDVFKMNGFSIRIVKKRHILWNYLYIYGIKSKKEVVFI